MSFVTASVTATEAVTATMFSNSERRPLTELGGFFYRNSP